MNRLSRVLSLLRYSLRCRAVRLSLGVLSLVASCCLLIALLWWGPLQREQTRLLRQLDEQRQARLDAQRLREAASAGQRLRPVLQALEHKLDVRAAQADLIQGVARLAARRGVRVLSQSFDEGRARPGAATQAVLYLELGLQGNYAALRGLMGDLATLPMWIEIVDERMERVGQGGALVKAQWRLLTLRNAKEAP